MKELRNKILRAINKGLNEALDLDDFSEDDLKILKKSLRTSILNSNFENKKYYYQDLMNLLMSKNLIDITKEDIEQCIDWYKEYNILYNPLLDNTDFRKEFKEFIHRIISIYGNEVNLNWIDTSDVTDMNGLFNDSDFNGDISKWDVSNVITMSAMFWNSKFTGDISNWDVSNVINMHTMFCNTELNCDISDWNISKVIDMNNMFNSTKFKNDFNYNFYKWDVSNVLKFYWMFGHSNFNQDISNWDISHATERNKGSMFSECPIKNSYKPIGI